MSSVMGNLAQQMQIITGPHPVTKHTRHPPATRQTCVLAGGREVMAGIPPFPGPLPMGTHSGWGPSEAVQPPCRKVIGTRTGGGLEAPVTSEHSMCCQAWVGLAAAMPCLETSWSISNPVRWPLRGWRSAVIWMRTRRLEAEGSQSARAADNPSQWGRDVGWWVNWGLKLLVNALWSHGPSLTKHKGKYKIIKNFKIVLNLL